MTSRSKHECTTDAPELKQRWDRLASRINELRYQTSRAWLPIAKKVLDRHEISLDEAIDINEVAWSLAEASDGINRSETTDRQEAEQDKRRQERIHLLDRLLDTYWERVGSDGIRSKEGGALHAATEDFWLPLLHKRDLVAVLNDLERLRDTETFLREMLPAPDVPNQRPVTAKGRAAEDIFQVLKGTGVQTWEACAVIAEMFIEAEIDNRPHNKIQRSLYDKLSRL